MEYIQFFPHSFVNICLYLLGALKCEKKQISTIYIKNFEKNC